MNSKFKKGFIYQLKKEYQNNDDKNEEWFPNYMVVIEIIKEEDFTQIEYRNIINVDSTDSWYNNESSIEDLYEPATQQY